MLKRSENMSSWNRDMTQNVILQGCDAERSRSFVKVKRFSIRSCHLLISTYVKFHRNVIANFSFTVEQSLTKGGQEKEERRKKEEQLDRRLWWWLWLNG